MKHKVHKAGSRAFVQNHCSIHWFGSIEETLPSSFVNLFIQRAAIHVQVLLPEFSPTLSISGLETSDHLFSPIEAALETRARTWQVGRIAVSRSTSVTEIRQSENHRF